MPRLSIPAVLLVPILAFPVPVHADTALTPVSEVRADCIQSMGLLDTQVASGLYEYRIERCLQLRREREGRRNHINRLAQRHMRLRIRMEQTKREKEAGTLRPHKGFDAAQRAAARRPSRRALQRSFARYEERKRERTQRRRQMAVQARDACQDVLRAWYSNCVRQKMRELGSVQNVQGR